MSRSVIVRRRIFAALVAIAATLWVWFLFFRDDPGDTADVGPARQIQASDEARGILAGLGTGEKVDQLILAGVAPGGAGEGIDGEVPGGWLVGEDAWPGAASGPALVESLRAAGTGAAVPPLIATRQEGGVYRALADLPPNAREIAVGDVGDRKAAEAWARQTATALDAAGFDLNLAPVADVASLDSPIADRAFSDDPAVTQQMTLAAIRGCKQGGLACAPSHFPGLGGATDDTTEGPAGVASDLTTLVERDLQPFTAAFAAGAPAVVVAHASYAALDPVTPASLAPAVVGPTGLLRRELGFEGVAITDDLGAGAVRAGYAVPDAAVAAIAAGADMVQITDPEWGPGVRRALVDAAERGSIPLERLDEAAARVLDLKRELGLF